MQKNYFAAAACGLALLAGQAQAAEVTVHTRPKGTPAIRQADLVVCTEIAKNRGAPNSLPVRPSYTPVYVPVPSDGGAGAAGGSGAGAALAVGLIVIIAVAVIENERAKNAAEKQCMSNLGYAEVVLTPEEAAERLALKTDDEREAWDARFMSQDLNDRITKASHPDTPSLPAVASEAWTGGGVRVDPATLAVSEGDLKRNATVVSGRATRRAMATLKEDVTSPSEKFPLVVFKSGSVFHPVDYRLAQHPLLMRHEPTWCGPATVTDRRKRVKERTFCLTSVGTGYEVYDGGSPGVIGAPTLVAGKPVLYDRLVALEPVQGAADSFPVEIRINSIGKSLISLSAVALGQGEKDTAAFVWTRWVEVKDGVAILPLWDKALKLTLTGKRNNTVKAELVQGDGHSWFYWPKVEEVTKDVKPEVIQASSIREVTPHWDHFAIPAAPLPATDARQAQAPAGATDSVMALAPPAS